jgi:WD40-like Beta Propeller Repeat
MKIYIIVAICLLTISFFAIEIYYPNQEKLIHPFKEKPNSEAIPLALGEISTSAYEWGNSFSPDGNEFYYSTNNSSTYPCIVFIEKKHEGWSKPQIAPFSGEFNDNAPFISPDGNRLFFTSKRPHPKKKNSNANICYVEKTNDGWSEVKFVEYASTEKNEFWPSVSTNGNLYFSANYEDSFGQFDLYVCEYKNGKYQLPKNLGANINSELGEYCPYIAPDESYISFESIDREDSFGEGDMYFSKKLPTGEWSIAKNMGETFNSNKNDCYMNFSHDRKYIFFTSSRNIKLEKTSAINYSKIIETNIFPSAGDYNIFWIESKVLDSIIEKISI